MGGLGPGIPGPGILCLCILYLCILVLAGCGRKEADCVERIQASGSFPVAVCHASEEELALVEQIAQALGAQAESVEAESPEAARDLVAEGGADLAIGRIPDTLDPGEVCGMSVSYAQGKLYVLTRRGDYSNSPAAFAGRRLGVPQEMEGLTGGWPTDTEGPELVWYTQDDQGMKALAEGTIDGYVCRLDQGLKLLEGDSRIQMQNLKSVLPEQYVILARKGDAHLLQGINSIIGTWEKE